MQTLPRLPSLEYATIGRRIRDLAIIAGQEIMTYHQGDELATEWKGDGSPVSAADFAANRIILDGLRDDFPNIPIITEEDGGDTPTDLSQPFFLIDPLDGTKEFIRGGLHFTVNIALIVHHVAVMGVVYAPATDRLQWTPEPGLSVEEAPTEDKDCTALFTTSTVGSCTPLSCRTANNQSLTAVLSRSHLTQDTLAYLDHFCIAQSSNAGSSLKFCLIAGGEADIYPRLSPTMEWDTAAAHAILTAAGGHVLNVFTGEELVYGKSDQRNPHFIAIGAGVVMPAPAA